MTPELLDILWERAKPVLFITKEEFLQRHDGWDIQPVQIDGELSFITCVNGQDFHFLSVGHKHRITRKMIRDFLTPIIAEHGYAMTRTPVEDVRQQRFNRAFGFQEVGQDGFDILYRIDRCP